MAQPKHSLGDFEIYGAGATILDPQLYLEDEALPTRAPPSRTWTRIFDTLSQKVEQALKHPNSDIRKKAHDRATNRRDQFTSIYQQRAGLPDDDNWQPNRPLGAGGFGAVASFVHYDRMGQISDHVVIKTAKVQSALAVHRLKPTLSKEAAIMYQTNKSQSENLLRLRNFKCMAKHQEWRFYLEYCAYGDLERLRLRYRAWGQYLPEIFLWHLFHGLVKGVKEMEDGPFHSLLDPKGGINGAYLVHSDLKPHNVLLGGGLPQENTANVFRFPIPKVADFGLARLTSWYDINNTADKFKSGTPLWFPPELRYDEIPKDADWYPFEASVDGTVAEVQHKLITNARFQKSYYQKRAHRIEPAANIWVIGAIMYQMITLDDADVIHKKTNLQLRLGDDDFLNRAKDKDGSVMPEFETTKELASEPEFSDELINLVCDCLQLRPNNRPSAESLLGHIEEGLQKTMEDLLKQIYASPDPTAVVQANRVKCVENEINELPYGPYQLGKNAACWQDFDKYEMWTPDDWPVLIPPRRISIPTPPAPAPKGQQFVPKRSRNDEAGSKSKGLVLGLPGRRSQKKKSVYKKKDTPQPWGSSPLEAEGQAVNARPPPGLKRNTRGRPLLRPKRGMRIPRTEDRDQGKPIPDPARRPGAQNMAEQYRPNANAPPRIPSSNFAEHGILGKSGPNTWERVLGSGYKDLGF